MLYFISLMLLEEPKILSSLAKVCVVLIANDFQGVKGILCVYV